LNVCRGYQRFQRGNLSHIPSLAFSPPTTTTSSAAAATAAVMMAYTQIATRSSSSGDDDGWGRGGDVSQWGAMTKQFTTRLQLCF
jgi:hypothetical protein